MEFSGRGATSEAEPDHAPRDLQGDDLGGGQVRSARPPVHRDGPALALRGRGDGRLHAQDHCRHLRGGPSGWHPKLISYLHYCPLKSRQS